MKPSLCALAWITAIGCTSSSSPLVESSPQIELTANPGHLAGKPQLELTLTTWNHLAALGDAVASNELEAMLDGAALATDAAGTGYFGNDDRYVAAYTVPAAGSIADQLAIATPATFAISDSQTTWSFQVANLMTNDLQPESPVIAGQTDSVEWPSAAQPDQPSSNIAWACVQVANRSAACLGNGATDPGIQIDQQYIELDVPAQSGDPFTVWGAREIVATSTGDGPDVLVTVLGQVTGTFQ